MKLIRGKAWILGDNLDCDYEISPFRKWRTMRSNGASDEELGQLAMFEVDPDFSKKISKGDLIVAGTNMGCGHDHDQGPLVLKYAGISAVIAESIHGWFWRNCVLCALPAVSIKGIKQKLKQGDTLELDYPGGSLTNVTTKETIMFKPLPSFLMKIVEQGGLYPHLKQLVDTGKVGTYLND